jgi:sigma54-dependent transcription regulator
MIGKSKAAGKTITREDYAAAQAKMQAMVDKGEITEDQMNARLNRMRKMIASGKPKATDKTITREDYAAAQAEMQAMVDKGEITEDLMNARLNRMRKMFARGNDNSERREMSDECKQLGRRIRTAVGNGDMTSEEARKLWEAEGCP